MLRSERLRATTIAAAFLIALVAVLVLWGARPAEAAFPGSNGKIAFSSNRSIDPSDPSYTDDEIFAMNPDGTGLEQLTSNTVLEFDPAWSADGKKIAFTSSRGGDYEIYVMKAKPESRKNRPKNLTRNDVSDLDPDWRPIPQP